MYNVTFMGFPGDSDGKEFACNAGDPGSGRYPGEGNLATNSHILVWRIPWTEEFEPESPVWQRDSLPEEPGGLESMGYGLQTVQHD